MSSIVIRRGGHLDLPFIRSMLTHAHNWHVNRFETDIPLSRYVDGWGRRGDTALIAIDGGHRVGAAWYRLFRASAPGWGFVDEATPELTVAVVPGRRGQGIGQELLRGLLERAAADGYAALSAAVQSDHPEVHAFEDKGFETVGESEDTLTMVRRLEQHA
jgi:GNAT superfamily N-acetyltransferase